MTCPICQDDLEIMPAVEVSGKRHWHNIHAKCLDDWRNVEIVDPDWLTPIYYYPNYTKCPVCRLEITHIDGKEIGADLRDLIQIIVGLAITYFGLEAAGFGARSF